MIPQIVPSLKFGVLTQGIQGEKGDTGAAAKGIVKLAGDLAGTATTSSRNIVINNSAFSALIGSDDVLTPNTVIPLLLCRNFHALAGQEPGFYH